MILTCLGKRRTRDGTAIQAGGRNHGNTHGNGRTVACSNLVRAGHVDFGKVKGRGRAAEGWLARRSKLREIGHLHNGPHLHRAQGSVRNQSRRTRGRKQRGNLRVGTGKVGWFGALAFAFALAFASIAALLHHAKRTFVSECGIDTTDGAKEGKDKSNKMDWMIHSLALT